MLCDLEFPLLSSLRLPAAACGSKKEKRIALRPSIASIGLIEALICQNNVLGARTMSSQDVPRTPKRTVDAALHMAAPLFRKDSELPDRDRCVSLYVAFVRCSVLRLSRIDGEYICSTGSVEGGALI